jgi:hypothetical protein
VVNGLHELPPLDGVTYVGFVDAASGSGADKMVLAIAHADADGVAVLDCLRGFAPPFSPGGVVYEMAAGPLEAYRIMKVVGDRWALGWVGERFQAAAIDYECCDRVKSDLYREFLGPLNSGRIRLLDHPQMVGELLNLERRVARGGHDSIDHPRGLHDDYINTASGALVLVSGRPRFAGWDVFEFYRLEAARLAPKPPEPVKPVYAKGSVEWQRQQQAERKNLP